MFQSILTAFNGVLSLLGLRAKVAHDTDQREIGGLKVKDAINEKLAKDREDAKKYRNDHRNDSDDDTLNLL